MRGWRRFASQFKDGLVIPLLLATAIAAIMWLLEREFEVQRMPVAGRQLTDIANSLWLIAKVAANHQSFLRQKLGANTAAQLLQAAARFGIALEQGGIPLVHQAPKSG